MGGSVCTWFFVPGGFLPSRWILVQREGWECFWTIVCCAQARSRFANSFGSWRRVSCSFAVVFFYARYTPRLTFTIPRRTFDDMGNGGGLRRIATAFYPLVVSDLRIVVHVWIRERFASGGCLRTAPALDVCALDYGETGIDSRMDNGLAVAALVVPGRSRLTATSHIVQRACSLPAGEIGVTASGYTLSQVALVIASCHTGDYLPLLAARDQESQDGWPDVKHRRVLRRLSLSLLLFLKRWWQFLLQLEALFFIVTSICSAGSCQVLFCACQDPLPWVRFAVLRVGLRRLLGLGSVVPVDFCSWCSHFWCCDCDACWSWWSACSRCCAWRAWSYAASGGFPI